MAKLEAWYKTDLPGAFADAAVLLPILYLLADKAGFAILILLASAGLLYLLSGWYFKVPMAVQPLKSVAIAAIAIGATAREIQMSAVLIGLLCLLLTAVDIETLIAKIPKVLIHCIQLALGVILIRQGLKSIGALPTVLPLLSLVLISVVAIVFLSARLQFPFLGFLALLGMGWSFALALQHSFALSRLDFVQFNLINLKSSISSSCLPSAEIKDLRWSVILSLVVPQLFLTFGNSVLGTLDVCRYYFLKSERVQIKSLLTSIGIGNVLMGFLGGLPFCHGSGGITAHVRGGARSNKANFIIGVFLLLLAGFSALYNLLLVYPPILISILLIAVGYYHLLLAERSWHLGYSYKIQLALAFGIALLTANIFYVVLAVTAWQLLVVFSSRREVL